MQSPLWLAASSLEAGVSLEPLLLGLSQLAEGVLPLVSLEALHLEVVVVLH